MKKRPFHPRSWMILAMVFIALSTFGWAAAERAAASELDKLDASLKLIPADAAFYTSMLRNREQVEAFLKSNAFAKIKAMPSVQMALSMYSAKAQEQGSPVWQFEAAQQNPEIKKIIKLATDMGSNEIFMYGGDNLDEFLELMQKIVSTMRYGQAILQATGEAQHLDGDKQQAKLLLDTLIDNTDLIEFPDVLIGFRLKNPKAADEALIKLETILNLTLEAVPKLKGHLNKETIGEGDNEYLVLRVDGKMVPWEEVPLDELKQLADNKEDFQKLVDHVKGMEFVLAMGVRGNDLLVTLGSSTDCIKKLGSSDRLIDKPEFKSLEKFADKRITGIGYISKELNEQANNNAQQIDDLCDFIVQMLPMANFTEDQNDRLSKDIEALANDIKAALPVMGSVTAVTFWADNGFESYQYNWGTRGDLDASKPLDILSHVGGDPILGIVARGKSSSDEQDKVMAKWVDTAWKYFEELGLPRIPEGEREKVTALINDLKPLAKRLNTCVQDMLSPALADGQIGLVIDAKLKSKQLHESMPELDKELPMIEPALVIGVSNADLLRKGMGELRGIYNDLLTLIGKQPDLPPEVAENLDNFKWLEPKVTKVADGSLYAYPLPQEWGVDKNIVPNAGLSDKVAVLTISTAQSGRMLKTMPLKVGGVLAKTDRPLAVAGWFDWAGLIGAATPWANYALDQMTEEDLGGQKESVIAQVHTVLEVLSTIKSITSESYIEDQVLVTHSLMEIHDLGK
jgi:hypothetical protein